MGIRVGETIGDYQVVRELGAGGMGAVFEVRHSISDRTEAMKVLLPDLEANAELAERFLREIRVHARLSHPGIAALHTALRHDHQLLTVMKYVEGESLSMRLRRGRLEIATALDVTVQLLSALAYAHSRSVIHRDIKPANIMLLRDDRVKLLDFGIARPLDSRLAAGLTVTGAAIGTLSYMSPEQMRGLPVDHRTDLYATGVTLHEMVTGVRLFSGQDLYAVMQAKLKVMPRSAEPPNAAVSPELSRIIERALAPDPGQRFQTAQDFSRSLEAYRTTGVSRPATAATPEYVTTLVETPGGQTPSAARPAAVLFEPDALARLSGILAAFLGPVAPVLVNRTARKATSWTKLYESLAAEIPGAPDRKKFLASCHSIIFGRQ